MTAVKLGCGAALALVLGACAGEPVTSYTWVDWTDVSETDATGEAGRIKVEYTGDLNKNASTGEEGRNEFKVFPATFSFADEDISAPENSDILRTSGGEETGEQVITFSRPVKDPIIAIYSLGSLSEPAHLLFENEIELLNTGPGPWGNGALYVSQGEALAINGSEGNGLIRMPGTYESITFTTPRLETDFGYQFAIKEP